MGRIRHTVTTQSALYPLCTVGQPEKENNYRHHLELIFHTKLYLDSEGDNCVYF